MALVVVRAPLDLARAHRQQRLRAVQRLNLAFSSTHSTSACSGGFMYRPTMSRTFSINSGSGDSLNVSLRCGCNPKARQIRLIVMRLKPGGLRHAARAPVRRAARRRLQRADHHVLDLRRR